MPDMLPRYADVVFPPRISRSFTYHVPDSWNARPRVGQWVFAPFGPRHKPGLIVSLTDDATHATVHPKKIRDLHRVTSSSWDLDPNLVALAHWMADYYLAPIGTCLALIQPPQFPFRRTIRWTITHQGRQRLGTTRKGTAAYTLLTALATRPKGLALSTIDDLLKNSSATLRTFKRQRWIQEQEDWTERPFHGGPVPTSPAKGRLEVSEDDRPDSRVRGNDNKPAKQRLNVSDDTLAHASWWNQFREHLAAKRFGEVLVQERSHVPPLANVIHATTANRRMALVLTPNVNQATLVAACLRDSVGDRVGEFHGGMSATRRVQEWQAIERGRYAVVVGTRSALFLPLPALGCLWVEQEEDASYKEEAGPHYHARDVARKRASLDQAVIVYHSPHPTLETVHRFATRAKNPPSFPTPSRNTANAVHVVNLQETPFGTILSDVLRQGIERALEREGGILVYHNRKGFASSFTCRDCGTAPSCTRCHVPFRLHHSRLLCPYCGQAECIPTVCPSCSGTRLEPFGFGTERLEEELKGWYPHAAISRYDGDAIKSESTARHVREQFCKGRVQILVGTQMLFHASPLGPVRCVAVPYADAGLHFPDFRSSERVFHHLRQAVDLLTPGPDGSAIIQTRLPFHHAMHAISTQQPQIFYDRELAFRRMAGYPPFGLLVRLAVSGKDRTETEAAANLWAHRLTTQRAHMIAQGDAPPQEHDAILGPLLSRGPTSTKRQRYHLLLKFKDVTAARTLVRHTLEQMTGEKTYRQVKFGVNVDPLDAA